MQDLDSQTKGLGCAVKKPVTNYSQLFNRTRPTLQISAELPLRTSMDLKQIKIIEFKLSPECRPLTRSR